MASLESRVGAFKIKCNVDLGIPDDNSSGYNWLYDQLPYAFPELCLFYPDNTPVVDSYDGEPICLWTYIPQNKTQTLRPRLATYGRYYAPDDLLYVRNDDQYILTFGGLSYPITWRPPFELPCSTDGSWESSGGSYQFATPEYDAINKICYSRPWEIYDTTSYIATWIDAGWLFVEISTVIGNLFGGGPDNPTIPQPYDWSKVKQCAQLSFSVEARMDGPQLMNSEEDSPLPTDQYWSVMSIPGKDLYQEITFTITLTGYTVLPNCDATNTRIGKRKGSQGPTCR
jgi:hypothetical protein